MFCSKCGNKIPDDAKFCSSCGQENQYTAGSTSGTSASPDHTASMSGIMGSDAHGSAGNSNAGGSAINGKAVSGAINTNTGGIAINSSAAGGTINGSNRSEKSGKKRKGLIAIAAAVVFIIISGVFVNANIWRFMSAKSYYGYLESRNKLLSLNKLYNDGQKIAEREPFSKEVVLTINDIGSISDIPDSISIDKLSLNVQIDYNKNKTAGYLYIDYMNNKLIDALFYQDKDTVGFGLPLLYDDYFRCDIDKISETASRLLDMETPKLATQSKSLGQYKEDLDKETEFIDKELAKYAKIALDNIPNDNFKVSKAGDISLYSWKSGSRKKAADFAKCMTVEFTVAEKDMYVIADKVLEAMGKDDRLIEFLIRYDITQFAEDYILRNGISADNETDMKKAIKECLEQARENLDRTFDPNGDETIMSMRVTADSSKNIISRQVNVGNSAILLLTYTSEEGDAVKEVNIVEGADEQEPTIYYLYDGKNGKGIIWNTYYGMNEVSYTSNGKGESDIGIGYGTYKLTLNEYSGKFEVIVSADKDESNKNTDIFKLRSYNNGEKIFGLSGTVKNLKDKSKLAFDKKKAIDLAELDKYEMTEITNKIGENFQGIIMELIYGALY